VRRFSAAVASAISPNLDSVAGSMTAQVVAPEAPTRRPPIECRRLKLAKAVRASK
jgi:hypothetical protein